MARIPNVSSALEHSLLAATVRWNDSRDGQPIHPLGLASHEVVALALDFGDRDLR